MAALAEIDWMPDRRRSEAGKLLLLNAHPILREFHGLSHAKLVVNERFVAHDDAGNGGVVIGPGCVAVGPDKVWNVDIPHSKAAVDRIRIRIEEIIRDRCKDLDAELVAIVQEVQVQVARLPVVEADQSHAH